MTDRELLEVFYHATGGPNWRDHINWLTDAPLSEWYGVATDGSGRVTRLSLARNRLTGAIPPELGNLAGLQWLSLTRNRLTGGIPPGLSGLSQLQELWLSDNQLSGTIPPELGQLVHLQYLWLAGNRLTGAIPNNLQQLSELTTLDVRDTQVCVPTDANLQAWLATLSYFHSSGLVCDGTRRAAFSASSYEVREGKSVTVVVRLIEQGEGTDWSVTVPLTATPGEGATKEDYAGVPENITITAPDTEAEFVFTAVKDDHFDDAETVVLGFRRPLPPGITAGDPDTATVRIRDPSPEAMADREVLEALYRANGGPNWRDHTNWLTDAPLSEWYGVATDRSGRVTRLSLSQNLLSGGIPPGLSGLTHLQQLWLSENQLSGTIPPELGALTHLQVLNLVQNQLSGAIPPELGGLTHLWSLSLGRNQLSGTIPPELGGLTHLRWLSLYENHLSGAIPPELGALIHLRGLGLTGNRLSGAIPPELAGLAQLQRLDLNFNQDLSGMIPPELQQLPLSTLDLMATSVCVPEDAGFQDWLATIEFFTPSGLTCGRPAAAMSSIDIAVFYTPAARRIAGGTAEVEALIDLMIAETNQAYLDGGVNQQIVLVAREALEFTESGSPNEVIAGWFIDPSDGRMDEVHAIRDQAGADLVHLIFDGSGGGGQLPGAFGHTCADCDSTVFAHELGHNMGLDHDRYQTGGAGRLPYSHGYVNQRAFAGGAPESARWRTIMAYPNQCRDAGLACQQILRFSNPNQTYRGDPLGVPGEERTKAVNGPADAVRTLNLTRHSVAGFRPRASGNQLAMPATVSQVRSMVRTIAGPAVPVPSGSLFQAIAPSVRGSASRPAGGLADQATLRRRQVSVDIGKLARVLEGGSTVLRLNLFDDVALTGIIERRTPTYSGGYALSGRLAGVAEGRVTLVVNGSVVAGTVRLRGATYRIRPAGAGRHAIIQVDPSRLPVGCETVSPTTGRER